MTITPSSPTNRRSRANLGSITALAESAWMGFPLAADVLEQLYLAPIALLRRGKGVSQSPLSQPPDAPNPHQIR